MRVYICHWQTRKSPTSAFYTSTKKVEAEDEEAAEICCKQSLADSFRDWGGAAHIIVTKTEHIGESS